MKLSFSQCSQPSQGPTPSNGLSRAMSRFGLCSQPQGLCAPELTLTQEPLAECGNVMDISCSQLSQPLWCATATATAPASVPQPLPLDSRGVPQRQFPDSEGYPGRMSLPLELPPEYQSPDSVASLERQSPQVSSERESPVNAWHEVRGGARITPAWLAPQRKEH